MTATLNNTNGKVRKSLASQLDRLDATLDGLADAIPAVVADTLRTVAAQAVQEAIQTALAELLTNPDVLAHLRAVAPQPVQETVTVTAPTKPSLRERLGQLCQRARGCLSGLRQACTTRLHKTGAVMSRLWQRAPAGLAGLVLPLGVLVRLKYPLLCAVGVGAGVAALAWLAGPWLAALLSGVSAFGSTLAVRAALVLRRLPGLSGGESA